MNCSTWYPEHALKKEASEAEPSWLIVQLQKRSMKFNSIETVNLLFTFPKTESATAQFGEGMFLKHTPVWWPKITDGKIAVE